MRIQISFFLGVIFLILCSDPLWAQDTGRVAGSDSTWQASYWNNPNLTGSAVLQRSESELNHDWGSGSPDPVVAIDGFSARWTRYIDAPAGLYRFTAESDDGIRVYVDGVLITRKRILVPLDGAPLSERALPMVTSLARQYKGRLILLVHSLRASTPVNSVQR